MPSADIKVLEKVLIEQEYRFLTISAPKVIVDGGAHIGLASVYFANRYPEARIIAVEPEPENFSLLKRNVAPYPAVTSVNAALWSCSENLHLDDPGGGSWGFVVDSARRSSDKDPSAGDTVAGITVDKLMELYGLATVDVLKLDIEGAEAEVLAEPTAWIDSVEMIIVELHDRLRPGCSDAVNRFAGGFKYEWLQGENRFLSRTARFQPADTQPGVPTASSDRRSSR